MRNKFKKKAKPLSLFFLLYENKKIKFKMQIGLPYNLKENLIQIQPLLNARKKKITLVYEWMNLSLTIFGSNFFLTFYYGN